MDELKEDSSTTMKAFLVEMEGQNYVRVCNQIEVFQNMIAHGMDVKQLLREGSTVFQYCFVNFTVSWVEDQVVQGEFLKKALLGTFKGNELDA